MRRISIYILIIFCTIIKAQDDLVTIKLKNGNEITGEIIQGGPDDYYVRIMTGNKKIKDIYTQDIQKIYKANTVIEQTMDTASNIKIPVANTEWVKPVETRIKPAKKQVEVTDNTSGKYNVPSKTLKKITAVSSLIFGISSAYFHYSSVRNYKLYQKSRNGNDVPKLREKVESADQLKITSLIISSISFIIHRYMKNKQNIIDKSYSD